MGKCLYVLCLLAAALCSESSKAADTSAEAIILAGASSKKVAESTLNSIRSMKITGIKINYAEDFPRLVESSMVKGLKAGFWVVMAGYCRAGQSPYMNYLDQAFKGAYKRKVELPVDAIACPTLEADLETQEPDQVDLHASCKTAWEKFAKKTKISSKTGGQQKFSEAWVGTFKRATLYATPVFYQPEDASLYCDHCDLPQVPWTIDLYRISARSLTVEKQGGKIFPNGQRALISALLKCSDTPTFEFLETKAIGQYVGVKIRRSRYEATEPLVLEVAVKENLGATATQAEERTPPVRSLTFDLSEEGKLIEAVQN